LAGRTSIGRMGNKRRGGGQDQYNTAYFGVKKRKKVTNKFWNRREGTRPPNKYGMGQMACLKKKGHDSGVSSKNKGKGNEGGGGSSKTFIDTGEATLLAKLSR